MIKVIENFITEEQEKELLSHIKPSKITVGVTRNNIIRYGSSLPYMAPLKSKEIPDWLSPLCLRVGELWKQLGVNEVPDSITINEYHPSQSIDWHIDSPTSGPIITVLSLKTTATMGLSHNSVNLEVELPQRSLLLLAEDKRWNWKHCIYPVSSHRFSLVFRKGTKK